MSILEGLNQQQKKAVETNSPMLVISGAGCGKTAVITRKICFLIKKSGVHPRRIAAVTFTNKAADEMRERVKNWLPESQSKLITIATFHSLGLQIIKDNPGLFSLRKNFSLLDPTDSEMILKDILNTSDKSLIKNIKLKIQKWQIATETIDQISQNKEDEEARKAYEAYEERKKNTNCLDFEDLLLKPCIALKETANLDDWKKKFDHILIDEYQDTNNTQYQLFKSLSNRSQKFTLVGDDDQSVYSWRGANPENLAKVCEDFPETEILLLEQNYRSTNQILKTANTLIQSQDNVFNKQGLWSEKKKGEPVSIIGCENEEEEAKKVIELIRKYRFSLNCDWQDFCILYRSNYQSDVFEKQLKQAGIPHKISGSTSLFDRKEVKDVLAYLNLIANPDNDLAFLRIVNRPSRFIGQKTIDKLIQYTEKRKISLLKGCTELGFSASISTVQNQQLASFSNLINNLSLELNISELIETLIDEADIDFLIKQDSENRRDFERKQQRVKSLVDWIKNIDRKTPKRGLAELLMVLNLSEKNKSEESSAVALMTVHSAKGLEFPVVFFTGMEEGLLPHKNSIESNNIEEELRIAYVGITRAQRKLTISYSKNRKIKGGWIKSKPSRFLKKIQDVKGSEGNNPASQSIGKEEALSKVRALFAKESESK